MIDGEWQPSLRLLAASVRQMREEWEAGGKKESAPAQERSASRW